MELLPCGLCEQLQKEMYLASAEEEWISNLLAEACSESERESALTAVATARRQRMQLVGRIRDHLADCHGDRLPYRNVGRKKEVTVVCMYCKRVQTESGGIKRWEAAESFPWTTVNLSHGICGTCYRKHLPGGVSEWTTAN